MMFTVPGEVVGKQRPKFSTFNGHAVAYTPQKTVNYENLVKLMYTEQVEEAPYDKSAQLCAVIQAYFPIPKSTSKKNRELMLGGYLRPTKKPDSDNIAKSVLDALNGIAFYDDSQIVSLEVKKLYSDTPRVQVYIEELYKHE